MTEYGRGPGSEPWHPEDPLYGDQGWGQQAADGRPAYGGQGQYHPQQPQQQHPQSHQQQPQQYGGEWGTGQHDQYGQQQYGGGQPQGGGWDTGQHGHVPYNADPVDPYGGQQQPVAYGGEQPDLYGTPDAYPPPEPPGRRGAAPETDWDPGPDQGEHAFFAGGGDDDGDDYDDPRDGGGRRSRGGKKPKKRRSGCACLVLTVIFAGGVGGVGYFGYQFYQDRFGSAPDYAGSGNGESVSVDIPKGAGGYVIGQRLKDAGVIKSVDAFVAAQEQNPRGKSIQDGGYNLEKEMSAESALEMMLSPKSRNNLIIAEGTRNAKIYKLIDDRSKVSEGTTAKVAKSDYKKLGLPDWALNHANVKDPLEGFLFPSSYAVAKGMKPEDVLKQMVGQANERYNKLNLEAKARSLDLESPWQVLSVASLVQAEGKTHDDFRKMAEVVYNRLRTTNTETNQLLQFDSTFNYLKGQSKINIGESEINSNKDPYNTYTRRGLPPGPIGNPGNEALAATLNPTGDGWMYFVATDGMHKTEFAKTNAEFERLKAKFNDSQGN
jgi:UPF0755 protein